MGWQWIVLILIILIVLVVALLTKPVQTGLRATALLIDLGVSYKWKTNAIPRSIAISEVIYPCGNRDIVANLYCPNDQGRHPSIILAHGAVEGGKDDPALKLAGPSLARAGYITLVPQLDNLAKFRLHQDDVEALVASFQYLSEQEFSNKKVGLVGVCLSAPLVLLAATEPSISNDISVIGYWGGYYNINEWLGAVITGHYFDEDEAKPWKPRIVLTEELPKWLIELMPDSSDKSYLEKMMRGDSVDFARSDLSPAGQALYEMLTSRDPARARDLWAKLDPEIQQTLDGLSPHLKADQLQTKIAIIHTYTDDVIPWVESQKLAETIKEENKLYYKIFHEFYHVRVEDLLKLRISNLQNTISEAAQFYLFIYHILYQL
ncbi:MAG: hypothetical protein FJ006_07500 [Chloroflexi bacterium]|nr:hypothetical protein [Chloroflexota bacterium]